MRAYEANAPLYCNMKCSGLARRTGITKAQKVENKRLYDMEYRAKNMERLKAGKAAHYKATFDREKERKYRKKNMHRHVEYCRQPGYRAKKERYDRRRRAKIQFGEFAEAFLILQQVESEVGSRIDKTEIYRQNGTQNKVIQRRREYARITNQTARSAAR